MNEDTFLASLRSKIEAEMAHFVDAQEIAYAPELKSMLAYHLGWEGEGAGPAAQGKRIRPLIVLLATGAAGGDDENALPAAAAVELIHNFSLIHDDIQDNSSLRHGRLTVWKKWGIAQAINAGDLMFVLAHRAIQGMKRSNPADITLLASEALQNACVELTRGQYLDLSYETHENISLDDYWTMVAGKTGALLSCAAELGAITAGADLSKRSAFSRYGLSLGLAFQAWDDWLGIWGDAALTGKSTDSDLVSGKKSLPVVFGLNRQGRFAKRWKEGHIGADEVKDLAQLLIEEGAQSYTQESSEKYLSVSIEALTVAALDNGYSRRLKGLTENLLGRKK